MNRPDAPRLRALVVDDEPPARRRLRQLLEATGRVEVVAQARSVDEATRVVGPGDVDVAFLDVHMPGKDGFAYVEEISFEIPVVFVTAYSAFAVRAFDVHAFDYLLKPVDRSRLDRAIDRVANSIDDRPRSGPPAPATSKREEDLLCLQRTGGARFVPLHTIVCILARGDYTEVVLEDGGSELVSVTMRAWEERLPSDRFTRLHRSAIAANSRIERIERSGGRWEAHLQRRNQPIPLSRETARKLRSR